MPRWFRVVLLLLAASTTWSGVAAARDGDPAAAALNGLATAVVLWTLVRAARRPPRDDGPVSGAPQDLRARGARRRLLPIGLALLVAVLGLLQQRAGPVLPLYALAAAALMVWQLRTGGDRVEFTDEALVVRTPRGAERSYRWEDVLELSWSSLDWPSVGAGPVVRVRGSVYDTPGPASPGQVAAVLLAGDEARAWGRLQVRRAAARHGVPYTDDLVQLIASGRRRPRLPGERS